MCVTMGVLYQNVTTIMTISTDVKIAVMDICEIGLMYLKINNKFSKHLSLKLNNKY